MVIYKGFAIWFNELQGGWIVQDGYFVSRVYKTIGTAKNAINKGCIK